MKDIFDSLFPLMFSLSLVMETVSASESELSERGFIAVSFINPKMTPIIATATSDHKIIFLFGIFILFGKIVQFCYSIK